MIVNVNSGRERPGSVRVYDPEKARMAVMTRWAKTTTERAQRRIDDLVKITASGRLTPEQQRQLAELAARQ